MIEFAAIIATVVVLAVGADATTFHAHLAIDPYSSRGPHRFTECPACPTFDLQLSSGETRAITVSMEPAYALDPSEIESVRVYEERSPHILGVVSYHVVVEPSEAWKLRTLAARDSHPYDSVAWLADGQLLTVAPNISSFVGGMQRLATFSCERDAVGFAKRLGHSASVIRQSDEDYRADVNRLNAYYTEFSADLQNDSLTPPAIARLLSEGKPAFPVTPEEYFGPGHKLPKCP